MPRYSIAANHQKVDFTRPWRCPPSQKPIHGNLTLGSLLQTMHGQNLGIRDDGLPVRHPPIVQRVRSDQETDWPKQIDSGPQRGGSGYRGMENQIAIAEPDDRHTGAERKFHQPHIEVYRRPINDPEVGSDGLENIDRRVQIQRGPTV